MKRLAAALIALCALLCGCADAAEVPAQAPEITVTEITQPDEAATEKTQPDESVTEITQPDETVTEITQPDETVTEITQPEEAVAVIARPSDTAAENPEIPESPEGPDVAALLAEFGDVTLELFAAGGASMGAHSGADCPNEAPCRNALTEFDFTAANAENAPGGATIALRIADGTELRLFEDSDFVVLTDETGSFAYTANNRFGPDIFMPNIFTPVRSWYDEAEFRDLGGYGDGVVIPNGGQSVSEAAREFCEAMESAHLAVSEGSKFAFSFVKCEVELNDDMTAFLRGIGEIDLNTYCIRLRLIFVPANDRAYESGAAGNTAPCEDADAPEGALESSLCGYIRLEENGYAGTITGTGW